MPCVSLLHCLYRTVLVTVFLPPPPSNVESACNDSGCEGPFKSTLHWGWRVGMREFAVFLRKCPKTFGQDCRSSKAYHSSGMLAHANTHKPAPARLVAVDVKGHSGEPWTGSRCTEVRRGSIVAPIVTRLVTIACVTGNEEAGVEQSIADQ